MKAVLLKSMRVDGVQIARSTTGPTIVDVSEKDFASLEARRVIRAATEQDMALSGLNFDAEAKAAADAEAKAAADAEAKAAADAEAKASRKKPVKAEQADTSEDL